MNFGTDFKTNTIVGGSAVFQIIEGAIGDQGILFGEHNGNKWFDKYFSNIHVLPFRHARVFPTNLAELSNIYVSTQQSQFNPFGANGYLPFSEFYPAFIEPNNTGWFIEDQNGFPSNNNCAAFLGGPNSGDTDKLIADGNIGNYFPDPVSTWQAERYLYHKLNDYPNLVQTYNGFQTFLTNKENTTVGKLYEVSKAKQDAFSMGASFKNSIEYYNTISDSLKESIHLQDSILNNSTNLTEIQLALNTKTSVLTELKTIDSLDFVLQSSYADKVILELDSAVQLNNQIIGSQPYEIDETLVNEIFLNSLISQNGTLNNAQINQLETISSKCPRTSGAAVYRARGILPQCDRVKWNDNYTGCYSEPGIFPVTLDTLNTQENHQRALSNKATIFPNPSLNTFFVHVGVEKRGIIKISSIAGQVIRNITFDGSS
ncbi:MAG: hypothetical protein AAFY76_14860, partial [Cyanobacteria bacterium J06649_11]